MRPRATVCLLPGLEVTHPPTGTMATGKQSHPGGCLQQLWAGLEGQAPSNLTALACLSLRPLALHPTRPQAPTGLTSTVWQEHSWLRVGTRGASLNQPRAAAAATVLRLRPKDDREGPAVSLPASVHLLGRWGGASRQPGARESSGAHTWEADTTSILLPIKWECHTELPALWALATRVGLG